MTTAETWHSFCQRLEAVGTQLLEQDWAQDPDLQAEGLRHVTRLLRASLEIHLEYGDPLRPHFVNHERPTHQWGGPNPDNYYLRAAIDPQRTYRIRLDATGVRNAIFSLAEGDMVFDQYGVFSEVSLEDLGVEPDGIVEIVVSPDEHAGNWMPSHPDAGHVLIRVYVTDWANDAAPYAHIELVDEGARPARLPTPATLAAGLDDSIRWVERSAEYWPAYLHRIAAMGEPNALSPPVCPPGGADNILYGGGPWRLDEGEALLVECAAPDADYWSFCVSTVPWFEAGEFGARQTSLNDQQIHVDTDGHVRVVVSHEDPGIPNWIDTEGRTESVLTYRWVWARTRPTPVARVVRLADLRGALPPDHPVVSPAERAAALRARAKQVNERFR